MCTCTRATIYTIRSAGRAIINFRYFFGVQKFALLNNICVFPGLSGSCTRKRSERAKRAHSLYIIRFVLLYDCTTVLNIAHFRHFPNGCEVDLNIPEDFSLDALLEFIEAFINVIIIIKFLSILMMNQ